MLKRDRLRKGLSVILIVTGILFLLYPGVSQLWNRMFTDLGWLEVGDTCTPYGINTHRLLIQGKRVS